MKNQIDVSIVYNILVLYLSTYYTLKQFYNTLILITITFKSSLDLMI